MRTVVSVASASVAALLVSLGVSGPASACYGGNCYGGYYQVGAPVVQAAPPVVQVAPPVYHTAPVYQAPVVQAPPVVVQQAPVYQAPVVQAAPPIVVDAAPRYTEPYRNEYYGEPRHYGYGRTVYYERGPEYQVSYREYRPYGYGVRTYHEGTYYAEPYYHRPYYRPYYRRPVVCSGGAYETGQALCGERP